MTDISAYSVNQLHQEDPTSPHRSSLDVVKTGTVPLNSFVTAHSVFASKKDSPTMTTGCHPLDDLLLIPEYRSLGLRAGELYEFYGSPGTGKTQLVHQLAVTAQLPEKLGGLGRETIWVDTEGTFAPSRVTEIWQRIGELYGWGSAKEVLSGIQVGRVSKIQRQFHQLAALRSLLDTDPDRFGLLVIDSVMNHFRAEFPGTSQLATRQQLLNHYLHALSLLVHDFGLVLVVTNQVLTSPDPLGPGTGPIGGHILAHWSHHRFQIRLARGGLRHIQLISSPAYPEQGAYFQLGKGGITEPETPSNLY